MAPSRRPNRRAATRRAPSGLDPHMVLRVLVDVTVAAIQLSVENGLLDSFIPPGMDRELGRRYFIQLALVSARYFLQMPVPDH